ncbi:hypothetical protein AJ78_05362 [Emergomyces pasteurianus Ep9510]|uniref:Knr4/Smi1-like domain-containing protein n=1 Tax=Emergomyces pasteurianus Ep9510 TaxID=1447872 RepID=A0A1J9QEB6_9EURO|nr:hypothetical protein AJ78_05362 [Emergomyces pasteurianus Ep9510]
MPSPVEPRPSNSNSNIALPHNNEDIKADIEKLRTIFASKRITPPLGWPAVNAFESRNGIILPEPYRTFVAEIANGCPDGPPHYGLESISTNYGDDRNDPEEGRLALPFPLTRRWIWEDDPELPEGFPSSAVDEEGEADIFGRGCLDLGTEGCGMHWYLIISGEQRGQIWHLAGEGAAPFAGPFGFTTAQQGFAGWVFHWASGKDLMVGSDEDHVDDEDELEGGDLS